MTLGELSAAALYSLEHSQHLSAESTYQIKSNAYSFGCTFAEVEVDIPMCKVKLLDIVLLDYKISTFMDHPRLKALFVENPEPTSAFGTKALGEPPTCSVAPAIRNAVYQASGVFINDAPVTPHNLFRKLKEEGLL